MTRPTRRTSCGDSHSVIFNNHITDHHPNTVRHEIKRPSLRAHERYSGRRKLQSTPRTPGSEKTRAEGRKGRTMAFKGIPSLPPFAWAVPPSPARDICFVFCAFPNPEPNPAITGQKADKQHQKNCANLCTFVQLYVR